MPDNVRIARKLPLPECIAQQRRCSAALLTFLFREEPSQRRLDTQRLEKVIGDHHAQHGLWLAMPGERKLAIAEERIVTRHLLE